MSLLAEIVKELIEARKQPTTKAELVLWFKSEPGQTLHKLPEAICVGELRVTD